MILGSSVYATGNSSAGNLTSLLLPTNFSLASVKNTVVTPTQVILIAVAGPMQVNLTILNPIEVYFDSPNSFNSHLRTHLSQEIGSSNRSHSHTFLSLQYPKTVRLIRYKCTLVLTEVRKLYSDLHTVHLRLLQSGCLDMTTNLLLINIGGIYQFRKSSSTSLHPRTQSRSSLARFSTRRNGVHSTLP
jgi:hypothetical protein